jgi:hypothetical protein
MQIKSIGLPEGGFRIPSVGGTAGASPRTNGGKTTCALWGTSHVWGQQGTRPGHGGGAAAPATAHEACTAHHTEHAWSLEEIMTKSSAVTGTRKVGSVQSGTRPEIALSTFGSSTRILKNSFGSGSGTRTDSIRVLENKNSLMAWRSFLDFLPSMVCDFTATDRVYRALFIFPAVGDRNPVLGTFLQSEANRHNASWTP